MMILEKLLSGFHHVAVSHISASVRGSAIPLYTVLILNILCLTGCSNNNVYGPDFLAIREHIDDIVIWDEVTNESYLDWHRAKELFPSDTGLTVALSYGLSSRDRLSISSDTNFVQGTIGYDLEDTLRQLDDQQTVYINSEGGRVRAAANAADVILEKELNFVVIGFCASACVEEILPAAKSVKAFDNPVFAVHGNMQNYLDYLKRGGTEPCVSGESPEERILSLEALVERTNQQLLQTGHKIDFGKKQKEVLGEQTIIGFKTPEGDCGTIQQFSVAYWLPTSEEFRTYFGLAVEGTLCNDNRACLENKLPLYVDSGEKVIHQGEEIIVLAPISSP